MFAHKTQAPALMLLKCGYIDSCGIYIWVAIFGGIKPHFLYTFDKFVYIGLWVLLLIQVKIMLEVFTGYIVPMRNSFKKLLVVFVKRNFFEHGKTL